MPDVKHGNAQLNESTASRNLAVVEEADAAPQVRSLYSQFRNSFGRTEIPGILKCFATHPPLLEHMIGLAQAMVFADGVLGRANKEMIATFVSAANRCDYCADSHGAAYAQCGGSADQLAAALAVDEHSEALNEAQRSLLRFVRKLSVDSAAIQPSDIATLREAGWSEVQIAEMIHTTALFAFFNRVVSGFGLPSRNLLAKTSEEASHE